MAVSAAILVIVMPAYGGQPTPPMVIGRFESVSACEKAGEEVLQSMVRVRKEASVSSKLIAERLCLSVDATDTNIQ